MLNKILLSTALLWSPNNVNADGVKSSLLQTLTPIEQQSHDMMPSSLCFVSEDKSSDTYNNKWSNSIDGNANGWWDNPIKKISFEQSKQSIQSENKLLYEASSWKLNALSVDPGNLVFDFSDVSDYSNNTFVFTQPLTSLNNWSASVLVVWLPLEHLSWWQSVSVQFWTNTLTFKCENWSIVCEKSNGDRVCCFTNAYLPWKYDDVPLDCFLKQFKGFFDGDQLWPSSFSYDNGNLVYIASSIFWTYTFNIDPNSYVTKNLASILEKIEWVNLSAFQLSDIQKINDFLKDCYYLNQRTQQRESHPFVKMIEDDWHTYLVLCTGAWSSESINPEWVEDSVVEVSVDETINQQKVQDVISLINGLPIKENITLDDEGAVQNARGEYNKLLPAEQIQVTNSSRLIGAEEKIKELKQQSQQVADSTERSQSAISAVISLINGLPKKDAVTLDDEGAVQNARGEYDKLLPAEQEQVTNSSRLTEAEEKIKELQQANIEEWIITADSVARMISGLPSIEDKDLEQPLNKVKDLIARYTLQWWNTTSDQDQIVADAEQRLDAYKKQLELSQTTTATTIELIEVLKREADVNKLKQALKQAHQININFISHDLANTLLLEIKRAEDSVAFSQWIQNVKDLDRENDFCWSLQRVLGSWLDFTDPEDIRVAYVLDTYVKSFQTKATAVHKDMCNVCNNHDRIWYNISLWLYSAFVDIASQFGISFPQFGQCLNKLWKIPEFPLETPVSDVTASGVTVLWNGGSSPIIEFDSQYTWHSMNVMWTWWQIWDTFDANNKKELSKYLRPWVYVIFDRNLGKCVAKIVKQ